MLLALSILALVSLASATQCPPLGSVRYMIPHENDCSLFYICAHGVPLLQSCPEGTHFNSNFMVCQNPVFAGCSDEHPESVLECAWPDFMLFRPHPDTCNKYYVCEYGTPLVFDCPGGTEFNAELKECVWPHESNCTIGARPGAPETTTDGPAPEDGGSPGGSCTQDALSAHSDCSKYYICDHGAQVAMDCPPGLQWNSAWTQCVWPHQSDCNSEDQTTAPETTTNGPPPEETAPENGGSQGGSCTQDALSAHSDCSKYYICDHGAQVAMDCPPGLQWNSAWTQCVWPHQSDCNSEDQTTAPETTTNGPPPEETAPENGGSQGGSCTQDALSAHSDCSKYYICDHGAQVAMDCPPGLQWNSALTQCVWPHQSDCNSGEQPEAPETTTSGPPPEETAPEDGGSPGGSCTQDSLSAHSDCSKYYICDHGAQVAMDCPPGLQWNSALTQCVWPHQSDCNSGEQPEAPETTTNGPPPEEIAPEDGGSPGGSCTQDALSAHSDCSKYYICDHGVQVAMDCPPGLQWNSAWTQCVWPHQSDCNSEDQTTAPETTTNGPPPEETAPENGGSQGGSCTQDALSAHSDCSKYYICDHGAQVAMDCPPGLQWNSALTQCVWPHQSDCNSGEQPEAPETTTSGPPPEETAPEDGGSPGGSCTQDSLSAHSDCSKYYICDHGAQVAMDCPPGLQWNSALTQCVWPHQSDCNSGEQPEAPETTTNGPPPEEIAPEDGGSPGGSCTQDALSAHSDCSKYYICDHGVQVAMDCPPGLQWNSAWTQCVWPHQSDCNSGQQPEAPETTTSGPPPEETAPEDGGSPGGSCTQDALSAHSNCSKYYICDHGAQVAMDCPSGLQWNSALTQCVWPHQSDCNSGEQPEAPETTTSGPPPEETAPEDGGSPGGSCTQDALSAHSDCSKYYICDHGAQVAMDCPPGLQWNSALTQCVWPHQSDCNSGEQPEAPETTTSGPPPEETAPEDGGSPGGSCTQDSLSAHSDCSKYYICDHGAQVAMDCPPGLQWNSAWTQCVWPHQSDCNSEDQTTAPETTTNGPPPEETAPENGGSQGGSCTQDALSAHSDCSKYYICDHGAQVAMDCPPGLQWNSAWTQCVWPHQSDCNSEDQTTAPETTTSGPPPEETAPEDGGSPGGSCTQDALSAHSNCSKYYICDHGVQVAMDCPPGLQWNSAWTQCVWPHQSDCNSGEQPEAPETTTSGPHPEETAPEDGGSPGGSCTQDALSAHSDCSKYYICDHGAQVAMDCPPGLQWNSAWTQCVWPHQSDCDSYASNDYQTDAPENGGSQDGGSQDGGSQDGGSGCVEGALSANEDCDKYYKCSHGVQVPMECPPGLHWNVVLQYCDWPSSAGCA